MSQEKLAEALEIATTSLSLIETGKGFVTANTLHKLADVLNVEVSQLFNFVKDQDIETYYNTILAKIEKYKNNKEKLQLLDTFLNAL